MKKQATYTILSVLIASILLFTAAALPQGRGNDKKEKKDEKVQHENRGKKDNEQEKDKNSDKRNEGNERDASSWKHAYKWDRTSFKERNKIKKQEKVTICHKFNNGNEPAVTINVSVNAKEAHLRHGDVMGDCPKVSEDIHSDKYWRNRSDYYNRVQEHNEQLEYSRSILDYSVQRLNEARAQLLVAEQNRIAAADIERKKAAITELEQNVTALEVLIGAAATLVITKLQ